MQTYANLYATNKQLYKDIHNLQERFTKDIYKNKVQCLNCILVQETLQPKNKTKKSEVEKEKEAKQSQKHL